MWLTSISGSGVISGGDSSERRKKSSCEKWLAWQA